VGSFFICLGPPAVALVGAAPIVKSAPPALVCGEVGALNGDPGAGGCGAADWPKENPPELVAGDDGVNPNPLEGPDDVEGFPNPKGDDWLNVEGLLGADAFC